MSQKKYSKEVLLQMDDALDILSVYLIKGVKQGLRFRDFEKTLKNKNEYPPWYFRYKGKITSDTLRHRLKQMVREGILEQELSREPYYLKTSWYNKPYELLLTRILEKTGFITPNIDYFPYKGNLSFHNIDLLFGLNKDEIPDIYKGEYDSLMVDLTGVSATMYLLKDKIINHFCRQYLNKIHNKLKIKNRNIWDEYLNENKSFYNDLISSIRCVVIRTEGEIPSNRTVETYILNEHEKVKHILEEIVYELLNIVTNYYPFFVGGFTYYDCEFTKSNIDSVRQKGLIKRDNISDFS